MYAGWDGSRWSVANGPQDGSTLFAAATAGGTTWAAGGIMPNRYVLVPITEVSR